MFTMEMLAGEVTLLYARRPSQPMPIVSFGRKSSRLVALSVFFLPLPADFLSFWQSVFLIIFLEISLGLPIQGASGL